MGRLNADSGSIPTAYRPGLLRSQGPLRRRRSGGSSCFATGDSKATSLSIDERVVQKTLELIREHARLDEESPVRPYKSPDTLRADLDLALDGRAHPMPEITEALAALLSTTPSTTSRRFFNQLFAGRDTVATMADVLVSITNTPMYTFKAGGPQVLLERACITRMASKAGYTEGDGIFTPGGSLSNMAAMIIARNETFKDARDRGLPGERGTLYTSEECHYSIRKGAGMVGIGRDNVRFVPTDAEARMDPGALREMIAQDMRDGATPVMINATSGTTVQGAFDPIPEIADVAKEFGIWLHVDAAWGGAVLLSETRRHLMSGAEQADSITWDAHKLMGAPLTSSVLLTREVGVCKKHFDEAASYLYQEDDDDLNPGRSSLQCGRRNDALKIWAAWKKHGDEGYTRIVEKCFALASHTAARVQSDPDLVLSHDPQYVNVCFEVVGKSSEQICMELGRRQIAKVGWGLVRGRKTIRMVYANPDVSTGEIDLLLDEIKNVAAELPDADNELEMSAQPARV